MLNAFRLAVSQTFDPAFRSVLLRSLLLTVAVFILLGLAVSYGLSALPPFEWGWLNTLIDVLAGLGFLVGGFFLFPAVVSFFISIFLEEIADAVESRYYPRDKPADELGIWPSLAVAAKFTGVVILLNIAVLPLYLLLFWLPPAWPVIFYGLNGYLLGREYFELVALRHLGEKNARDLRIRYQNRLILTGLIIAFSLTIPLVNLIAPIVATAMMVHVFKGMQGSVPVRIRDQGAAER
jgi:CysZ protein